MAIKKYLLNNKKYCIQTDQKESNTFSIKINNRQIEAKILKFIANSNTIFFEIDGNIYKAKISDSHQNNLNVYLFNFNKSFTLNTATPEKIMPARLDRNEATQSLANFQNNIKSPLAGRVIKINVSENQFITKNQPLVVIESMKMENEIRATQDAFVKNVQIAQGDLVQENQVLMIFESKQDTRHSP